MSRQGRRWWWAELAAVVVLVGAVTGGACGGNVAVTEGPADAGSSACRDDNDCQVGEVCSGGACIPFAVDAAVDVITGPPVMTVDPTELSFGSPLVGQEVVRTFTIENTGEMELEIRAMNLVDSDPVADDFTGELGAIPMVLAPGESHTCTVTLRPSTGELDFGRVIIDSNDPTDYGNGAGKKEVRLETEPKGDVELAYCVLTDVDGECDYSLEFGAGGHLTYGAASERLVKFWNSGSGNRVLTAESVTIEVPPANLDQVYNLTRFTKDGDTETPVVLPMMLVAADPTADPPLPATELFVRVRFTALEVDGVVPGQNLVLGLAEDPPGVGKVPITGLIDGCRPDHIDCDDNLFTGCEVACAVTSADDTTCDGVDDNCNCVMDEDFTPSTCGVGACVRDSTCLGGVEDCAPGTPAATDNSCDNVDNDCNGSIDDAYQPYTCGTGECVRNSTCVAGFESCTAGTPGLEVCDGLDNDCNGTPDNDYEPYTCGTGECQRDSVCVSGGESCTPGPVGVEVCDGLDNDCNGTPDNGTGVELCGTIPHGTPQCSGGVCSVASCASGYVHLDSSWQNGCECQIIGSGGSTCATAYALGRIEENGSMLVTPVSNLLPVGSEEWYTFVAGNLTWNSGCNPFDLEVRLAPLSASSYRLEVFKGSCTASRACDRALASPDYYSEDGECPCIPTTQQMQANAVRCSTHETTYYLRVTRAAGASVACGDTYQIEITNG